MKPDFGGPGGPSGCRFCGKNAKKPDYKDVQTLQKYVTSQGKIIDRVRSGTCAKCQRKLSNAIERSRFLGLMRYCG